MCTFDLRPENCDGMLWTVYETESGHIAVKDGRACTGLSLADADDLADALNYSEANNPSSTISLAGLDLKSPARPCDQCRQLLHA